MTPDFENGFVVGVIVTAPATLWLCWWYLAGGAEEHQRLKRYRKWLKDTRLERAAAGPQASWDTRWSYETWKQLVDRQSDEGAA